jgi:hypothetical protein
MHYQGSWTDMNMPCLHVPFSFWGRQAAKVLEPAMQAAQGHIRIGELRTAMASVGVALDPAQVQRAKRAILEDMHGAYKQGFMSLQDFSDRFLTANPDAVSACCYRPPMEEDGKRAWVGTFIMPPQVQVGRALAVGVLSGDVYGLVGDVVGA